MANESYEDFARALQTEYEEDCGVTFGKVPITAIARLTREVDGEEVPIGKVAAETIRGALVTQKMLEADGRIRCRFRPSQEGLQAIVACRKFADMEPAVTDLLGGSPDRAAHPQGAGREAKPPEKGSHAQPGFRGAVEQDKAKDDLPR